MRASFAALFLSCVPLAAQSTEAVTWLNHGTPANLEHCSAALKTKARGFVAVSAKGTIEIPGPASSTRLPGRVDLVVQSPAGTDPEAAYHLRRLQSKRDHREVVVGSATASPLGASVKSTGEESLIPLVFQKYGDNSYRATVDLSAGEYAIGRAGSRALFCFGVD